MKQVGRVQLEPLVMDLIRMHRRRRRGASQLDNEERHALSRVIQVVSAIMGWDEEQLRAALEPAVPPTVVDADNLGSEFELLGQATGTLRLRCIHCGWAGTYLLGEPLCCASCGGNP